MGDEEKKKLQPGGTLPGQVNPPIGATGPTGATAPTSHGPLLGQVAVLTNTAAARGWLEQFEVFLTLNNIDDNKKVLLFISYLGPAPYNIMREMCLPQTPVQKTFLELKNLLLNYVSPPNFFIERYNFRERRQQTNESIAEYIKNLRKLSEFCKFADKLEDHLRDQLVWGIKRKLLSDGGEHSFAKCCELATSMETAIADCSSLSSSIKQTELNLVKSHYSNSKPSTHSHTAHSNNNPHSSRKKVVCYCCGKEGHVRPSCNLKNSVCKKCGKKGHITSNCKSTQKTHFIEDFSSFDVISSLNVISTDTHFVNPIYIRLLVNNVSMPFLADTGSAISAMNVNNAEQIFSNFNSLPLQPTDLKTKVYNNEIISPLGILKVNVNSTMYLDLYIFEHSGQGLAHSITNPGS